MTTLNHICTGEYRNEGWGLSGSGVLYLNNAWDNDDDTKYASCPSYKGRGCVNFPVDITSVPDGAVITSVTVYLRCNKTDTNSRSVTVNILSSDDTSQFTSRTIYPTTSISTIQIGTYQRDPLGNPWDRDRLNSLLCQVFSYESIYDIIRCYKLYCVINYRVRPTVAVNTPTGTVTTPAPVVSWTYAQADGDPQAKAEYRIFTSVQQESPTFTPQYSTPVYAGTVNGDITSVTLPTALTPDAYYIYVRVYSSFNAKSFWIGRSFTVQGVAPGVPGGGSGGGGGGVGLSGGAGFVSVVPDSTTSSAFVTIRDGSNLLSVQQANFEEQTDGLGYVGTNCTPVRDTSAFFNAGTGSMKLSATAAGTMYASSSFTEVTPQAPVTARAQFRAAVTTQTVNLRVLFFDANFGALSGTLTASGTDPATTWTEVVTTGTTPLLTAYAKVECEIVSPLINEVHNVDGVGLMYGTNSVWSHGGHASRNLLSAIASNADNPPTTQTEPWTAASVAVAYTRAVTTGTGADGSSTFKLTYNGISTSLSFVAAGTVYSDTTTSTGYTLNKPAGVVDGDLLVAFVSSTETGTLTVPNGWTLVNQGLTNNGSLNTAMWVLKHDGLTSDPSTWVGNVSTSAGRRRAVVLAYRGAASAANQFVAENVATYTSGATAMTTPSVTNTDPGAWRVGAFAVRDDASAGSMIANVQAPSGVPPISFVGAGTSWTQRSASSVFTLNKPAGIVSGDLMIASLAIDGNITTVTPPSGWTLVRQTLSSNSTSPLTFAVMKRTAGASEPNSWSGSLSSNSAYEMLSQVSGYHNCDTAANQFIAENTSTSPSGATVTTASVSNTNSAGWRVSAFGATAVYLDYWSSSEVATRSDTSVQDGTNANYTTTLSMHDSNGPVGTGSHQRTGTLSESYYAGASWIGIIKPLASAPAAGANETQRTGSVTGSADPWLSTYVYDSAAVVATGSSSLTGVFTPSSGAGPTSAAGWIGLIKPASPTVAGEAGATLAQNVTISSVDRTVLTLAQNKVTMTASFLGSTAGTPYLTLFFYNGNELIGTQLAQGTSMNTTTWTKSSMTVTMPDKTTRIGAKVHVSSRAVADIVYYDRVSIAFGSSNVYRPGTARSTHPIWSVPVVEYAEDPGTGYGGYSALPGTSTAGLVYDQLTGVTTFRDQTIVPLTNRKYRTKTLSYGLAGDRFLSAYGPDSLEVAVVAADWWLKDLVTPANSLKLKVRADKPLSVPTVNTAAVFQPLGEDLPIVLTEGYKGDLINITVMVNRADYAQLRKLLKLGRSLYLQSNMDNAWWVRPVGDALAETQLTGQLSTNPLRFVALSFVQVKSEL